jgi:hypothetical protein
MDISPYHEPWETIIGVTTVAVMVACDVVVPVTVPGPPTDDAVTVAVDVVAPVTAAVSVRLPVTIAALVVVPITEPVETGVDRTAGSW